jgi:hypothetical protein
LEGVALNPKQFRQQTLWPTAAEPTIVAGRGTAIPMGIAPADRRAPRPLQPVEFQVRGETPNGGTWSSWQTQRQLRNQGERTAKAAGQARRAGELDSGQRAMFMTAGEIIERYQPLDGDRYEAYGGTYDGTTTREERLRAGYGEDPAETDEEV